MENKIEADIALGATASANKKEMALVRRLHDPSD